MADLDERLSQLLSDPAAMERLTELARAIQTRQNSADPAAVNPNIPSAPSVETTPLTAVLSNLLSAQQTTAEDAQMPPQDASSASASPLLTILPQIMQALSGNGDLVKRERVNLLQAMRPYLKSHRTDSIERAIKMANITKAATLAMHELGR